VYSKAGINPETSFELLNLGKQSRTAGSLKPSTPNDYGQSFIRATLFCAYFSNGFSGLTKAIPHAEF
jgi:hypothetical protein